MKKSFLSLLVILFIITFSSKASQEKIWFDKGVKAYNVQTNADYAVHCFTQALAVTENYVPALLTLGDLYSVRGQDAKAKRYFLRAVQNHRDSEYALRRLSVLYESKSNSLNEVQYLQNLLPEITNNYLRLMIIDYLGDKMFSLGKIEEGRSYFSQLAPVTNWMVAGGFDNDERTGLRKNFEPEKNLSLGKTYKGKEWDLTWRPAVPFGRFGNINFLIIRPKKWITAYIRTGIISPQQTSAVIHLSFAGAYRMWLNGKPVAENDKYHAYKSFMHRIPIELNSGTNICVFKLCMKNNKYSFSATLSTPDNQPLFLKNIQPDDNSVSLQCEGTKKWQKPLSTPGITFLESYNKTNENLYNEIMLGRYYSAIRNYDKGIKQLEKLMKKNKAGAVDMFFLGRCYSRKDCGSQAVAAYRKAFAIDPLAANAQTAVAAHYADRNLYDLAQPILEKVLLKNTNCLYARLELINVFNKRGWKEDAYRLARETCMLFPDYPIVYNKIEDTVSDRNCEEIVEKAFKQVLDCDYDVFVNRLSLAKLFLSQRRFDEFFKQINILENIFPHNPDVLWLKLKAHISLRDITNSYKVCKQALEIFPDHSGFHKKLGDIFYMSGEREKAIEAYHTTLKYSSGSHWLRQYLDFLEGRDQVFFDKYRWTEKQVKKLVEKYKNTEPVSVEEFSRILLRQNLVQVFNNGSSRHMYHFICKVLHPRGVKNASSINLPSDASGRLLRAVTYKKGGKIIEATHLDSGQVEFPDVQVGDTIELKCMWDKYAGSRKDDHYYSTYAFDYDHYEVVREELAIAIPTNRPVRVFVRPVDMICNTSNFESSFVRHWILTNVPMRRLEPLSPPYDDVARRVSLSTITNWSIIADWQRGMVSEIVRGDENVTALAKEITQNATSDMQKVEFIFNYITENFRYTQMYENRIAGIKPHPIPDILANRCGDCKDLSLLMVEMLKAVKIPASTVLMRTADRGQILTNVPTPDVFNHVLVFIPGNGKNGLFVDPTYRLGEFNLLPAPCQNVEALVINDNGYELIKTPLAPVGDSITCESVTGEVFNNGSFTGFFGSVMFKNDAADFRLTLENISKTKDIGSYIIGKIDPSATLISFGIENRKPHNHKPIIINSTFSAPQFGRRNNGLITFPLPFSFNSHNFLKGLETRIYPMKLRNLGGNSNKYTFKIPDGYEVDIAEKNCSLKTKSGTFDFKAYVENSVLYVNWSIILTKQTIEVEEYTDFRNFLTKCSRVTGQVVTLQSKNESFLNWIWD